MDTALPKQAWSAAGSIMHTQSTHHLMVSLTTHPTAMDTIRSVITPPIAKLRLLMRLFRSGGTLFGFQFSF